LIALFEIHSSHRLEIIFLIFVFRQPHPMVIEEEENLFRETQYNKIKQYNNSHGRLPEKEIRALVSAPGVL